ncbi:cation diffusion facilitator family transporter [Nakamurella leprariae]|uniref:cation diffusion facilitator family transporter n=1 Tax=Nakamurella leprariae TaxID=2803911 RepID=UPI001F440246
MAAPGETAHGAAGLDPALGSAALVADGLHARTDGLTSLAVVLGALGVWVGWPAADPVSGIVIAVAILLVLSTAGREVFRRLLDGVEPQLVETVADALRTTPGVRGVRRVRMRWSGHQLRGEADIEVDPALTALQAQGVAHAAEQHAVSHTRRLTELTVHTSPAGGP